MFCAIYLCAETLNSQQEDFSQLSTFNNQLSLDDIILDIYNAATEMAETDYEQLQSDLYALHESPINLNAASEEELAQLYFLSPRQIDDILAYADRHPFQSLYELRLIPSLADYEIRDLLPFVTINPSFSTEGAAQSIIYPKEVFAHAKHELVTRVDARNIEGYEGDPVYVQARYRFDYRRRVTLGLQLRRPAGGGAEDLQYGAYIHLRDIAPHLHTLVAGNFQASFGQGLVLAPVFHTGKSAYVQSVGQTVEGLRHYASVDGEGLHGAGTTMRWEWSKNTRLDASVLYSMKRANDSVWHHLIGANLTLRHRQLQLQFTAVENLWSDSIHPYRDAAYNRHYFRGYNQAVLGASARYNYGWFDAFAELATAQNHQSINPSFSTESAAQSIIPHWGFALIAGSRFYPCDGLSLVALYRYYSPFFDNALGYAFSETSRINDENGGYLGFDITRLSRWRFSGYADIFYFSGPKYGIPKYPTLGYDVMAETQYIRHDWRINARLRARRKGAPDTFSARMQAMWQHNALSLRTTAEANIIPSELSTLNTKLTYGFTVYQDIAYDFSILSTLNNKLPLAIRARLQWFDAWDWDNRIYAYEHDVLYAFSVPAVYGVGGRAYIALRWRIIPQLALYLRVSETVYQRKWAALHDRPFTRTDIHLLLRAVL